MKIKSAKELKEILDEKGLAANWLSAKLGYSTSWMYKCVQLENEIQVKRILKILREMK